MKLISLIFILAATTSCFARYSGPVYALGRADYKTQHGFSVYDQTGASIPKEQIEKVVASVAESFKGRVAAINGYKLVLVNDFITIKKYNSDETTYVIGQINPFDKFIAVTVFPGQCFANTKLIHELQHVYHLSIQPIPDFWHDDATWWRMMKKMEKKIQHELCGKFDIKNWTNPK